MSLLHLANELLLEILEYFDHRRDMKSFMLVNKRFYELSIDRLYLHNIRLEHSEALIWAAWHGHDGVVRTFLHYGANFEVKTIKHGWHSTMFEASHGHRTRCYRNAAAKSTPLHLAAQRGHLDVLGTLLDVGATLDARNDRNESPILVALLSGQQKAAIHLLAAMADISVYQVDSGLKLSPLHLSSRLGLRSVVKYLLKRGVDPDTTDNLGLTALHHTIISRCCGFEGSRYMEDPALQVATLLLDFGADSEAEAARTIAKFGGRPLCSITELVRRHPNPRIQMLFNQYDIASREQPTPVDITSLSQTHIRPLHTRQSSLGLESVRVQTGQIFSRASFGELSGYYRVYEEMIDKSAVHPSPAHSRVNLSRLYLHTQPSASNKSMIDSPLDSAHFPALSLPNAGEARVPSSNNVPSSNIQWSNVVLRGQAMATATAASIHPSRPSQPKKPTEDFPALTSQPTLHPWPVNTQNWAGLLATEKVKSSTPLAVNTSSEGGVQENASHEPDRKNQKGQRGRKWKPLSCEPGLGQYSTMAGCVFHRATLIFKQKIPVDASHWTPLVNRCFTFSRSLHFLPRKGSFVALRQIW